MSGDGTGIAGTCKGLVLCYHQIFLLLSFCCSFCLFASVEKGERLGERLDACSVGVSTLTHNYELILMFHDRTMDTLGYQNIERTGHRVVML
jgi:hypothetical protein